MAGDGRFGGGAAPVKGMESQEYLWCEWLSGWRPTSPIPQLQRNRDRLRFCVKQILEQVELLCFLVLQSALTHTSAYLEGDAFAQCLMVRPRRSFRATRTELAEPEPP